MSAAERLIVALDFIDSASAVRMAQCLRGLVRTVKVGSALFTASGPAIIQRLRALGFGVMLDLKFFDIPSTVELSCRAAAQHRVALLTVHAAGGRAMLAAAVRGTRDGARRLRAPRPLVLGVTVLTSVGDQRSTRLTARVIELGRLALQAGCDGVVASAREASALRVRFGQRLRIVCPGIRLARGRRDDQQRVSTPGQAIAHGADILIVGRPILASRNPRAAVRQMLDAMEGAPSC